MEGGGALDNVSHLLVNVLIFFTLRPISTMHRTLRCHFGVPCLHRAFTMLGEGVILSSEDYTRCYCIEEAWTQLWYGENRQEERVVPTTPPTTSA